MNIVVFCHSLISDWNHGNAHFLRGVVRELRSRGNRVEVYEPRNAWSVMNLFSEYGEEPVREFHRAYPGLRTNRYEIERLDLDEVLSGADVVIAHEWNDPALIAMLGKHRREHGDYRLLFHDTHHRIVTAPDEMKLFDLEDFDGVLAFGEAVAEQYRRRGWGRNVWVWHEAADVEMFRPLASVRRTRDLVWVGNWGDDERSEELMEFLIQPVRELKLRADVWGVRYSDEALEALDDAGINYHGWVPNFEVPGIFASARFTVHVPRRIYARKLSGIPTIRPFEAMACGIPLISAPWSDSEKLFVAGRDYLVARDGKEMERHMTMLLNDESAAAEIAKSGLERVRARHTCSHRVDELLAICTGLRTQPLPLAATASAAIQEHAR